MAMHKSCCEKYFEERLFAHGQWNIFLPSADNLIIFNKFKFQLYNIYFEDSD